VFTEYHTHEMATDSERKFRNALKFGQSGEISSKEGVAFIKWLELAPPNRSEGWAPNVELNGAVGEAFIQHSPFPCLRTKLLFDVIFKDDF